MLGSSNPSPNCALQSWLSSTADPFIQTEALAEVYQLFADITTGDPDDTEDDCRDLLEQFLEDDRFSTYLVATKSDDPADTSPRLKLLHHPKFMPARVGRPSIHSKKFLSSIGPPVQGHFLTAEVPSDMFTLDTHLVKTATIIQAELLTNPDWRCIDSTGIENQLASNVQTVIVPSGGIWLPLQYAKLCVDHDLTPASAWHRIYPSILASGQATACLPLIQFLQSMCCHLPASPKGIEISFPVPDVDLLRERASALHQVQSRPSMPPTGTPGTAPAPDLTSLIQALRSSMAPAPMAATPVPVTAEDFVAKRWAINLPTLTKLNLVQNVSALPLVWSVLARGPKKQERNILQAAYDEFARNQHSFTNSPLVVTKELCASITNLTFWAGDADRLDEGLHPFRTVYTSVHQSSLLKSLMLDYDLLATEGTVTSADIANFRLIFKSEYPTTFLALNATLRIFTNVLAVILHPTHPFRLSFQGLLQVWTHALTSLSETFSNDLALPAAFLCSIQLQSALYWQCVVDTPTLEAAILVPPPELVKLLHNFRLQQWIPPTMPGFFPPPTPTQPHRAPPPSLPAPPLPPVRPAPLPVLHVAPPDAPAPPRTRVANNHPVAAVQTAMSGRRFRLRTLLQNGTVCPVADDNQPLCLSYHMKFYCFQDCFRRVNHRQLTPAETTRLTAFVQSTVVEPNIGIE